MSMANEAAGISESNSTTNSESSNSSNSTEIKKLDAQTASKVISLIASESGCKEETNDSHLNRLQNLRSELSYISETDWMYESLEKKPQQ